MIILYKKLKRVKKTLQKTLEKSQIENVGNIWFKNFKG